MNPRRLLIVEDEIILAMDMEARLVAMGYHVVDRARTAAAAISATDRHRPDLILMDICLSGEPDGIEAALQIRRSHDIPVIFLTAYTDEETHERALAVEPCGFLSKLAPDTEVRAAIEAELAGHRVPQEH